MSDQENMRQEMENYDAYIFDLDGTLLDTLRDLAASTNHAMRTYHLPEHSIDEVRRFVGNGVSKLIERAVPDGKANPLFAPALDTFREHYLIHQCDTTKPYPGIMPLLRRLKEAGKATAVVSNKFDAATKALCQRFFGPLIDVAIGESEQVARKPAPDTVIEALRLLGISSQRAVYVGDSEVDLATAANCAMPCISVLWGFRDRDCLVAHGAKVFATQPADIF